LYDHAVAQNLMTWLCYTKKGRKGIEKSCEPEWLLTGDTPTYPEHIFTRTTSSFLVAKT